MERKFSLLLYVGALIASAIIFIIGIYIGHMLDQSNLQTLSNDVSSVSQKVESVQLLILMEGNSSSFCPVYMSELSSIDSDVSDDGYKLSYLEDVQNVQDPELKKSYFVLEAQSYLLSQKVKALCGDRSVLLINFYSNTNCTNCKAQGTEILQSRDTLAADNISVKLFSFDGDLGSPVADAFKLQYNITSYPSIVIDDKVYRGYLSADQIDQLIRASR